MWNLLVMWICNKIQKYDDYYAPHLCMWNMLELDMAELCLWVSKSVDWLAKVCTYFVLVGYPSDVRG